MMAEPKQTAPPSRYKKAPVETARQRKPSDGAVTVQALPVDMLFEIFSYLHPLDLLHLGWVNTTLRDFVMNKSYRAMWMAARKNVCKIPDPFPGMSEPAWAALAFVQKCSFCSEKTVMHMDLYLRCRVCSTCAKTRLVGRDTDRATMPEQGHRDFDARFRLLITNRASHVSSTFADDYALRSEYDAIDFTSDTAAALKFAKRIYAHAKRCEKWLSRCEVARADELHDIKRNRAQAICDKLSEIGYAEEIRIMPLVNMRYHFDEHPLVKMAQPLTNRVWTNIRDEMIVFAKKLSEKRIIRDRQTLVVSRRKVAVAVFREFKRKFSLHQPMMAYPSIADFVQLESVQSIIKRPGDASVSQSDFAPIVRQMPGWFDTWRHDMHTRLLKVAAPEESDSNLTPEQTIQRLQLVTNGLVCTECSAYLEPGPDLLFWGLTSIGRTRMDFMPVFYPDYLTHVCCVKRFGIRYDGISSDLDDGALSLGNVFIRVPVDLTSYEKDCLVQTTIHRVVRLIGFTPSTATVAHMDATDCLFECGVCLALSSTEALRPLYSWREMVQHCRQAHFSDRKAATAGITVMRVPAEIPDGWELAETVYEDVKHECLHCRDVPTENIHGYSHQELMDHIQEVHDNNQPVEAVDYQRRLGMPSEPRVMKVSLKKRVPSAVVVADHPLE